MRLRLDLSYDGTGFHGWARQPGLRTVQGELEGALATVLRLPVDQVTTTCAGRTDSGVHARGQVAHLDASEKQVLDAHGRGDSVSGIAQRLNGVLDSDLWVRQVAPAPPGFDARFAALWRRYAYRIADAPALVDPLRRTHVLALPRRTLDLGLMNEAAAALLGEHDFAAFCRRRVGATTIRTLLELAWARDEAGLAVATVRADAFCHHLVRSLMGALVPVGEGRRPVSWPADLLGAAVRDSSVVLMPGHGLVLEEVGYPETADLAAQVRLTRAVRTLNTDSAGGSGAGGSAGGGPGAGRSPEWGSRAGQAGTAHAGTSHAGTSHAGTSPVGTPGVGTPRAGRLPAGTLPTGTLPTGTSPAETRQGGGS